MDESFSCCLLTLIIVGIIVWVATNSSKTKTTHIKPQENNKTFHSSYGIGQSNSPLSNHRFTEVSPGVPADSSRVTLNYPFESNSSNFVKEARAYHSIEGTPVSSVPFTQYWPTFQSFNTEQKKWYFFWRSEVRQGRYLKTDLSYIFVYVYELLCLVEFPDPAKAAEQIRNIWRAYRPEYPNLDHYLPEWCGDLLATKLSLDSGIDWWREVMTQYGKQPPPAIFNIIIQKAVDEEKFNEMPYDVWAGMNLYHPQNKFYQRYNLDGVIDRMYLEAIHTIDRYFLSLDPPSGLLDKFVPTKLYPQITNAFSSAIVPNSYQKQVLWGAARNFTGSSHLGNLLAAITKYTENILRKQEHFSARLSGFELEERFQRILNEKITITPVETIEPPIRITLNTGRIKVLKQESERVSEMLEPEAHELAKTMYSDIAQVRTLWEKIDLPAKRLLLAIYSHKVEDISQVTAEIIGSETPFFLIDRINKLSFPLLGDQIISVDSRKQLMVADDFVDEMELIAKDNPFECMPDISAELPTAEVKDPWQLFLQQLSADESDLLMNFVTAGSLREDEIEVFARSRGQMGNLMDSISEKAIEQLERTPFFSEDNCWLIEEEDLGLLREKVGL